MTLLASIHDVAPPHLVAVRALREVLDAAAPGPVTLLVVPDFHGRHPLERAAETVRWLRERAAAGDEICLHGHIHLARRPARTAVDRIRAALFTAGEGECLTLAAAAARRMLADGRRRLEDVIGAPVRGFVAPAWLEPARFATALAATGFGWHEGSLWVERLGDGGDDGDGRRRLRTPVIGFATRTRLRRALAVGWAAVLTPLLARTGARHLARVALHPADVGSAEIMAAARRTLRALARTHAPATYSAALGLEAPHVAAAA